MNKHIYFSVDGGGTKTDFCLLDADTGKVHLHRFKSANYKTMGVESIRSNVGDAYRSICEKRSIRPDDVMGAVFGLSGCDTEQDMTFYSQLLRDAGVPSNRLHICNDTELIFRAHTVDDGICIIAGTGSIACGFQGTQIIRFGGWGPPLSDEGSGYWIGREALSLTLRALDMCGRDPETEALRNLVERFRIPGEVLQWTLAGLNARQVASLAQDVIALGQSGDVLCGRIMRGAAEKIGGLIVGVCERMTLSDRPIAIVASGGLMKAKPFSDMVCASVRAARPELNASWIKAHDSPAVAGLRYAKRMFPLSRAEKTAAND